MAGEDARFAELLRQVTELQGELSKTVAACHGMRGENDQLRKNYEKIKMEHEQLRDKYAQARRQALEEAQAKVAVEQQHEELVKTWRAQLEQKAQEFESLQESLAPPRDLDMLRIKIQEDLEAPHLAKVQSLQGEIEHYRTLFFNVRREHEILKTEFEQFTVDQGKEAESTHEAHLAEVGELRRQLGVMQTRLESNSQSEAMRALQIEIDVLRAERDRVLEESSELRKLREDATVALEQARLVHGRETAELSVRIKGLEADFSTLQRKEQVSAADARRADEARSAAAAQVVTLEADCAKLRHAVEEAERRTAEERHRSEKKLLEQSSAADRERHEFRASVEAAERRLAAADARHQGELSASRAQAKEELAQRDRDGRRTRAALDQAEAELESLRSQLGAATRAVEAIRREHSEAGERARVESEAGQIARICMRRLELRAFQHKSISASHEHTPM